MAAWHVIFPPGTSPHNTSAGRRPECHGRLADRGLSKRRPLARECKRPFASSRLPTAAPVSHSGGMLSSVMPRSNSSNVSCAAIRFTTSVPSTSDKSTVTLAQRPISLAIGLGGTAQALASVAQHPGTSAVEGMPPRAGCGRGGFPAPCPTGLPSEGGRRCGTSVPGPTCVDDVRQSDSPMRYAVCSPRRRTRSSSVVHQW
jgi:hypothetical protein